MSLLGYELKEFSCETAYLIFASIKLSASFNKRKCSTRRVPPILTNTSCAALDSREALNDLFTAHDMKRLEGYAHNLLDYHVIIDLLPTLSRIYFSDRLASRDVKLAASQEAILLGLGLQHKNIDQLAVSLSVYCCNTCAHSWVNAERTVARAQPSDGILQQSRQKVEQSVPRDGRSGRGQSIA